MSVYRQNVSSADRYVFLGRYRGHYKPIRALFFGVTSEDNQPIVTSIGVVNRIDSFFDDLRMSFVLFSSGADRILAEYDLNESEIDHLVLKPLTRIEQTAEPISACHYPPSLAKDSFLVTVNNE